MTFLSPMQGVAELFVQALFYGLYISTFVNCLRWLLLENEGWKFRPYKQMTWPFITITVTIFAIATADIAAAVRLTCARLLGEEIIADFLSFICITIEGFTMIIIDAVLVYRCWIVYDKSWRVIIVPLLFWTCTTACSLTWTICNAIGVKLVDSPKATAIGVGVFYGCNFATNVYASSAIVYRIWKTAMTNNPRSRIYEVCRIISGTGIMYSVTSLFTLVAACWINNYFPEAILNAINFHTACIAYNLVIIRVGQLRAGLDTFSVVECNPNYVAASGDQSSTNLSK
ncbi:hypothetical protein M378DRAFT_166977 [Amanita muscaria Koide BX008]|uniref:Uncharacterized protein n=1 Tax=Amanita muscaria (strain Koide BX008) TaxID=946122 RepID=A0A0C2WWX8_AMAMK|nr:hypothetical protein M378DRAFT_166977 [Amanita muscaria Koide BX008]